jgi:hypothetical protein
MGAYGRDCALSDDLKAGIAGLSAFHTADPSPWEDGLYAQTDMGKNRGQHVSERAQPIGRDQIAQTGRGCFM